ncbi:MAG: hypothetical protein FWG47_04270 [Propionibacteriaceae bacterium]|nr:hypothetical protein [Propionibacteriaceae bacterium]
MSSEKPASSRTKKAEPVFTPTPEAKASATTNRIIAIVMWVVAIGLEAFAIFWVLRPSFDELAAAQGFPQWRFYLLIGLLVVIAALAIIGSQLWKKANHLDPASSKEPVRFFVQNQLGAIIAIIAFVPLIILIFLNKDMDGTQKGIAGGIGIVLALAATFFGIDFTPLSQEQAAVESQVVTQLVGEDKVFWTPGGNVMHLCENVSDFSRSTEILSGTTADAFAAGKTGITLNLRQELGANQCNLPTPDNIDEIEAWVREARAAA